jgi:hypothetical protein
VRGGRRKQGAAQILHDADWNAYNSFEQPDRVAPKQHSVRVDGGKVQIHLPRLSVVTVVLPISERTLLGFAPGLPSQLVNRNRRHSATIATRLQS